MKVKNSSAKLLCWCCNMLLHVAKAQGEMRVIESRGFRAEAQGFAKRQTSGKMASERF